MKLLFTGISCGLLLAACGEKQQATTSPAPPLATEKAAVAATPAPRYSGIYTVTDTAVCKLSITVTQRPNGYYFTCDQSQGPIAVSQDESGTYFTFVGLKGDEPAIDIAANWQDSVLLIQNYGNSMNEYTRFGGCNAKYLELRRQR